MVCMRSWQSIQPKTNVDPSVGHGLTLRSSDKTAASSYASHLLQVDPQPPPIAEFAAGNLSAENPPEKLRRAELAAEFC